MAEEKLLHAAKNRVKLARQNIEADPRVTKLETNRHGIIWVDDFRDRRLRHM